ncbi:hypothetical protein AN958_04504 [Leucoagaricus sp. SymC.cos]|nr:hypothetical protein AN958_04504 [Leucoagaricus sp. SymC.cos]
MSFLTPPIPMLRSTQKRESMTQYVSLALENNITSWTAGANDSTLPIYWMRGPAGVGKSAIAQTCVERVKEGGHLGAAFFFINGRSDPRRLFPTLAYPLSTLFPDLTTTEVKKPIHRRLFSPKDDTTRTPWIYSPEGCEQLTSSPVQDAPPTSQKDLRKTLPFLTSNRSASPDSITGAAQARCESIQQHVLMAAGQSRPGMPSP